MKKKRRKGGGRLEKERVVGGGKGRGSFCCFPQREKEGGSQFGVMANQVKPAGWKRERKLAEGGKWRDFLLNLGQIGKIGVRGVTFREEEA